MIASLAALSISDPTRADEGETLILIADANRKIGFITEQGQVVVAPQFDEGLAAVYTNSLWGYIDLNGQWAIEPQFDKAFPFSEGLAAVGVIGPGGLLYGYIDQTGKFVIEPQYGSIYDGRFYTFSEGLAKVNEPTFEGYIDRTGKFVIEPRFVSAEEFKHGVAEVQQLQAGGTRQLGYINLKGEFVWGPVEMDKAWQGPWWY
jgi:hypothetical protein